MQTEPLLYWSDMTDTEHTTSGSNETKKLSIILEGYYCKHRKKSSLCKLL